MKFTKRNLINTNKGLTLVELIVVLSIFVVTSTIVMFNYSSYRSHISLENLAQDIALTTRKAQVFALGVKGVEAGRGITEFTGYGVHFYLPNVPGSASRGTEKSFIFFSDIPPMVGGIGNLVYDQTTPTCNSLTYGNECMDIVQIASSDVISELCIDSTCANSSVSPSLDIFFNRPNPNAIFCFRTGSSSCTLGSSVKVKVKAADGQEKVIVVWNTGQIYVQ